MINCIILFYDNSLQEFEKKSRNIENCSNENIRNILKEAYKRFVVPFYIPVLSLISLFLIITSKENSNYHKLRLLTFALGFFVIIFGETTIRFISNNKFQNLTLIIIPIIMLILIYFFLIFKFKSKL